MLDLNGKTAFISGGAGGIGYALAAALGAEGMNVCIADIDTDSLETAAKSLTEKGVVVEAVALDVTSRASFGDAAKACADRFGKVHLLVNNAGVWARTEFGEMTAEEWNWLIDVNIKGVVNGVETFVPLMREHNEGGHVVNVASVAGFQAQAKMEAYSATKSAVIGMSEAWRIQLADTRVSVSVVCPGAVRTNIGTARRNRADQYGGKLIEAMPAEVQDSFDKAMAPETVAARVVEGIKSDEQHIFTHPEYREQIEARFGEFLKAFDRVDESAALKEDENA